MRRFARGKPKEHGLTLVELLVASAIMGVVGLAGTTTYQRYLRSSQQSDLREVMISMRKEIEVALANPHALTRSLSHSENSEFLSCFGGHVVSVMESGGLSKKRDAVIADANLSPSCRATQADKFYPLVLQSPRGGVLSGGTSNPEGTRSSQASRVLTARGLPCTEVEVASGNERCEVEVTTAFRAVCAPDKPGQNPASECVTPESAEFYFTVRQLKTGLFFKRGIMYPSLNNMIRSDGGSRSRVDALTVNARDFIKPDFFQCPEGQTMRGFDQNGKIICGFQENPCARLGEEFKNWIFHGLNPDGTVKCKKPLQGEVCPSPENPLRVLRGVLPDGRLDCVDPKISNQGCKEGQVLVRFDREGNAVCVDSVVGKSCPRDKFLVGFDSVGNPRCVTMKTPSGELVRFDGPKCGHQHTFCSYTSPNKPAAFIPSCPEGYIQVNLGYQKPQCCDTCGWIGQWWCDYLYVECSPVTTARWQ